MALGYLISPVIQVEDVNGKPLTGGRIRVYRHGTQIPYITYKDWMGNLNPAEVRLDAKGMCILIAEDDNLYDVYCENANYVPQWSRLNVAVGGKTGGGESDLTFTSSDGSVDIVRDENNVDFSIPDLSKYPKKGVFSFTTRQTEIAEDYVPFSLAEAEGHGENTIHVTPDNTGISVKTGNIYHITARLEFDNTTFYGSNSRQYYGDYFNLFVKGVELKEYKTFTDLTEDRNFVEISFDYEADSNRAIFGIHFGWTPSYGDVVFSEIYVHEISNTVVTGGGGGEQLDAKAPIRIVDGVIDNNSDSTTTCNGDYAWAQGAGSHANGDYSIAIGSNEYTGTGDGVTVNGHNSIGIGDSLSVSGNFSCAIGDNSTVTDDYAISIGDTNYVDGTRSAAIGNNISIDESSNYCLGIGGAIDIENDNNLVIGKYVNVSSGDTIAVTDKATIDAGYRNILLGGYDNKIHDGRNTLIATYRTNVNTTENGTSDLNIILGTDTCEVTDSSGNFVCAPVAAGSLTNTSYSTVIGAWQRNDIANSRLVNVMGTNNTIGDADSEDDVNSVTVIGNRNTIGGGVVYSHVHGHNITIPDDLSNVSVFGSNITVPNNGGNNVYIGNSQHVLSIESSGLLFDGDPVGGTITIDTTMDPSSNNAIANSAVYAFVNSSIDTNTAYFLGTSTAATQALFEAWLDTLSPSNNDYVFWQTVDSDGNTIYKRYKYNSDDSEWLYEYSLNNSSFTAAQWASINSGMSNTDKTKLDGIESGAQVNVQADWSAGSASPAAILNKPTIPSASTSTPLMDGTASSGSGTTYARGNHRHPTDTSRQAALPTSGIATDTYAINVSGNAATATNSNTATKLVSGSVYCDNQSNNWYKIATFTQTNSKLNGSVGATIAVIQGDLALKSLGGTTEFGLYNFVESRDGTGTDWSRYNKRNEYIAIGELTGISFGIVPSIVNSKLKIDVYAKSNPGLQNNFTFTVLNSYGSGNDSQEKTVDVTLYNPVSTDGQTTVDGLLIAPSRALYPAEMVSALPASPEDGVMYLIPET